LIVASADGDRWRSSDLTLGCYPLHRSVEELPGGVLPARESEIARVVALGMTNKEIAAALTISPKTVAARPRCIDDRECRGRST
jgi:DNA-binding NarL/FixJ family response regulator